MNRVTILVAGLVVALLLIVLVVTTGGPDQPTPVAAATSTPAPATAEPQPPAPEPIRGTTLDDTAGPVDINRGPTTDVTPVIALPDDVEVVTAAVGGRALGPVDGPVEGTVGTTGLLEVHDDAGNVVATALAVKPADGTPVSPEVSWTSTAIAMVVGQPGTADPAPEVAAALVLAAADLPETTDLAEVLAAEHAADPAYLTYTTIERTEALATATRALADRLAEPSGGPQTQKRQVAQEPLNPDLPSGFTLTPADMSCDRWPAYPAADTNPLRICVGAEGTPGGHDLTVPALVQASNYMPRWAIGLTDANVPVGVVSSSGYNRGVLQSFVDTSSGLIAFLTNSELTQEDFLAQIDVRRTCRQLTAFHEVTCDVREPGNGHLLLPTDGDVTLHTFGPGMPDTPQSIGALAVTIGMDAIKPALEVVLDLRPSDPDAPEDDPCTTYAAACALLDLLAEPAADAFEAVDPADPDSALEAVTGLVTDVIADTEGIRELAQAVFADLDATEAITAATVRRMRAAVMPWLAAYEILSTGLTVNDLVWTLGLRGYDIHDLLTLDSTAVGDTQTYRLGPDDTDLVERPSFTCGDIRAVLASLSDEAYSQIAELSFGYNVDAVASDAVVFGPDGYDGRDELALAIPDGTTYRVIPDGIVGEFGPTPAQWYPYRVTLESREDYSPAAAVACEANPDWEGPALPAQAAASRPVGIGATAEALVEAAMQVIDAHRAGDQATIDELVSPDVSVAIGSGAAGLDFAAADHRAWYPHDLSLCTDYTDINPDTGQPHGYFECGLIGRDFDGQDLLTVGWSYLPDDTWQITLLTVG